MMGEKFQLIQDTSRQQPGWILPVTVNTVKCSWWWAKTSPETCRADKEKLSNLYSCILLVTFIIISRCTDSRTSSFVPASTLQCTTRNLSAFNSQQLVQATSRKVLAKRSGKDSPRYRFPTNFCKPHFLTGRVRSPLHVICTRRVLRASLTDSRLSVCLI